MLHSLTSTSSQSPKRIGRGGKRGKTSGRGHKGQKQHGGTPRPEIRDTIKRLPKRRGHGKNRARTVVPTKSVGVLNVGQLEKFFTKQDIVSPATLVEKKIFTQGQIDLSGVKILGTGNLTVALRVTDCVVSKAAQTKIEAAGGSVVARTS